MSNQPNPYDPNPGIGGAGPHPWEQETYGADYRYPLYPEINPHDYYALRGDYEDALNRARIQRENAERQHREMLARLGQEDEDYPLDDFGEEDDENYLDDPWNRIGANRFSRDASPGVGQPIPQSLPEPKLTEEELAKIRRAVEERRIEERRREEALAEEKRQDLERRERERIDGLCKTPLLHFMPDDAWLPGRFTTGLSLVIGLLIFNILETDDMTRLIKSLVSVAVFIAYVVATRAIKALLWKYQYGKKERHVSECAAYAPVCTEKVFHSYYRHEKAENTFMRILPLACVITLFMAPGVWSEIYPYHNARDLVVVALTSFAVYFFIAGLIVAVITYRAEREVNRVRSLHIETCIGIPIGTFSS